MGLREAQGEWIAHPSTMSLYRRVNRLDPEIAAYIAGLIDGEGTITLCAEHRCYKVTHRQALQLLSQTLRHFLLTGPGATITGTTGAVVRFTGFFL